jgi:hypothetical protein
VETTVSNDYPHSSRSAPVIKFACPRCETAYEVPDAAAGKKSNCRKCGQRLKVPGTPPINQTVLGLPFDAPPAAPAKPSQPSVPVTPPPAAGGGGRKIGQWLFIGGGALAVVVLVCAGLVGLVVVRPLLSGPSASREGNTWTHDELLDHLKKRGVDHTVFDAHGGTPLAVPTVHIIVDGRIVRVSLEKSNREAREVAGLGGKQGFAWGRFAFVGGGEETIKTIRDALEPRSGPTKATPAGKSKVNGKIVKGGEPFTLSNKGIFVLSFVAEGGSDKTTYKATTKPDGTFTILGPKGKGIPAGKYVVNLTAMDPYPTTDKLGGKYAPGQSKLVVEVGKGDLIIEVGK